MRSWFGSGNEKPYGAERHFLMVIIEYYLHYGSMCGVTSYD
jgi:hypothetical protein